MNSLNKTAINSNIILGSDQFKLIRFYSTTHCIFLDEFNECASSPCINGECVDGEKSYTCNYDQGFGGVNCEGLVDLFVLLQFKCDDKQHLMYRVIFA